MPPCRTFNQNRLDRAASATVSAWFKDAAKLHEQGLPAQCEYCSAHDRVGSRDRSPRQHELGLACADTGRSARSHLFASMAQQDWSTLFVPASQRDRERSRSTGAMIVVADRRRPERQGVRERRGHTPRRHIGAFFALRCGWRDRVKTLGNIVGAIANESASPRRSNGSNRDL